jgi:hypothetical protein
MYPLQFGIGSARRAAADGIETLQKASPFERTKFWHMLSNQISLAIDLYFVAKHVKCENNNNNFPLSASRI